MMMPLQEILTKYKVQPRGVAHVGAHWAEEHDVYKKCGIETFVYIEPCKEAFVVLKNKFSKGNYEATFSRIKEDELFRFNMYEGVYLMNYACGYRNGLYAMYVSHDNQGQSNSLLTPKLHKDQHPDVVFNDSEIVRVEKLDDLLFFPHRTDNPKCDMLAIDVQGYEGEVLKGAEETLKHVNIIYTEVNRGQTYSGNMEIEEMDRFLGERGFTRVETYWPSPNWTWGDAVYIKNIL